MKASFLQLKDLQQENEKSIRQQLAKEIGDLEKRLQEVETNAKQQDEKIASELRAVSRVWTEIILKFLSNCITLTLCYS